MILFFFNDKATPEIYTYGHILSLHDALPISSDFCRASAIIASERVRASPTSRSEFARAFESRPSASVLASVVRRRSEEHTSELQSLMRISYAVFCLKKKNKDI